MIEDGTAIGSALATAVNRLRASTAPSKFVVLLTDGQSNAGKITPQTAAEAAAALGIKVYTIGAGTRGMAPFPTKDFFGNKVYRPMQVDIDEADAARRSPRRPARATSAPPTPRACARSTTEIDRAEKTPFEAPEFLDYRELYPWLLWPALAPAAARDRARRDRAEEAAVIAVARSARVLAALRPGRRRWPRVPRVGAPRARAGRSPRSSPPRSCRPWRPTSIRDAARCAPRSSWRPSALLVRRARRDRCGASTGSRCSARAST